MNKLLVSDVELQSAIELIEEGHFEEGLRILEKMMENAQIQRPAMTEATEIVLDLAKQNVIDAPDMDEERTRQQDAVDHFVNTMFS